jgi:hypothetical protein
MFWAIVRAGRQVVLLEDEADAAAQRHPVALAGVDDFGAEHADAAFARRAQTTHDREQGALAGSRWPGQHDHLTRREVERQIAQHGLHVAALAVRVAEVAHLDQQFAHQNTSAGSSPFSLRIASSPENAHIATVTPNTTAPRSSVMAIGSWVASAACV